MNSVIFCDSSEAVQGMLALVNAQQPILDVTYGNGTFWKGFEGKVIGMDINPERAKDVTGSFLAIPFPDGSFPTVVYDPPYHPDVHSAEEERFASLGKNEKELKMLYQAGLRECWRVTSRHLLVKCQGFVHNHAPQWMELWTCEVLGEPFEWLTVGREGKRISGRWVNVKSLRRNHATYLMFDKRGNKR